MTLETSTDTRHNRHNFTAPELFEGCVGDGRGFVGVLSAGCEPIASRARVAGDEHLQAVRDERREGVTMLVANCSQVRVANDTSDGCGGVRRCCTVFRPIKRRREGNERGQRQRP
jgi:hypothetical protein